MRQLRKRWTITRDVQVAVKELLDYTFLYGASIIPY